MRKADLLITVETTEEALEAAELFFQYYRENANYLERTYDFVERARHREDPQRDRLRAGEAARRRSSHRCASESRCRATRGWREKRP